jgi:hypothetical protein
MAKYICGMLGLMIPELNSIHLKMNTFMNNLLSNTTIILLFPFLLSTNSATAQSPLPPSPKESTRTKCEQRVPKDRTSSGVLDDYRFETSDFMQKTAYRRPDHIATDISSSGAESRVNIDWDRNAHLGKWFIEQQRYGGDAVDGGIAKRDTPTIERGLKILHWGFEQQQEDGAFDCPDSFHSTSFFVESAAHACLMLLTSPYAERYKHEIDWMLPHLYQAAKWMIKTRIESMGRQRNLPYTHRRYLVGAALGETGVLCQDNDLIQRSKAFVYEGFALQDPSGINPEKGGSDTSYQAAGLYYAERYYDIVADNEIKPQLLDMLRKGNQWLTTRIQPDGTIDATNNTRTGTDQELSRNGIPKTVNYGITYRELYHWSLINRDPTYENWAQKVYQGQASSTSHRKARRFAA